MLPASSTFAYDAGPAVTATAMRGSASRIRKMVSGIRSEVYGRLRAANGRNLVRPGHVMEGAV
jgi:hypothetical protein